MNRSLVAIENLRPPKELGFFFDDPPLVGTERREDYDNIVAAIARAVGPADAIEWIMLADVAHISWEIRRERFIKAEIIKLKQKEALNESSFRLTKEDYRRAHGLADAEPEFQSKLFKKKTESKTESKPEAKEDDPKLLAKAYMDGARDIDVIDTRLASYEHRRIAVLREIAVYGEAMARKLDRASRDVIDGEFTEAAE
jgi:hypothetical protein